MQLEVWRLASKKMLSTIARLPTYERAYAYAQYRIALRTRLRTRLRMQWTLGKTLERSAFHILLKYNRHIWIFATIPISQKKDSVETKRKNWRHNARAPNTVYVSIYRKHAIIYYSWWDYKSEDALPRSTLYSPQRCCASCLRWNSVFLLYKAFLNSSWFPKRRAFDGICFQQTLCSFAIFYLLAQLVSHRD